MSRRHSFPIPLEKCADRSDIVEDIPKRAAKKNKNAKHPSKASAIVVEPVKEQWNPISLKCTDLPLELADPVVSDDDYSSGFDEDEREFFSPMDS